MINIVFSVFPHGIGSVEGLSKLLNEFERQSGIHVDLDMIPSWSVGWSRLVEVALYHAGPDVSEVGSTWVEDLIRMDVLRPYGGMEIDEIANGERYINAGWQKDDRTSQNASPVHAIPIILDVRVIFYRRDLLKKVGVEESTAFVDFLAFERTLSRLKESGAQIPLALPTCRSHINIHYLASWVWGAGGDFLSPDGTRLAFNQPQALEGFKAFFRLGQFLGPDAHSLEEAEADDAFCHGKAAVLPSGSWILLNQLDGEVYKNLGVAPMPGSPFVGGHDLVIWKHSQQEQSALQLIQFLHTPKAAGLLYPQSGLPVRERDWSRPPFDSSFYQVLKTSILKGRSLPTAQLWGLVEKRLTDVISDIWAEVLKEETERLDVIVESHINDLAQRLQLSMGS